MINKLLISLSVLLLFLPINIYAEEEQDYEESYYDQYYEEELSEELYEQYVTSQDFGISMQSLELENERGIYGNLLSDFQYNWLLTNTDEWLKDNVVVCINGPDSNLNNNYAIFLIRFVNDQYYGKKISFNGGIVNWWLISTSNYIENYNGILNARYAFLYSNNGIFEVDSSVTLNIPRNFNNDTLAYLGNIDKQLDDLIYLQYIFYTFVLFSLVKMVRSA